MHKISHARADRARGTVWDFLWPLLFVCAMTVFSMVTQNSSGYMEPQPAVAQTAQPSPTTAR
jgi:hypothetical protein